MQIFKAGRHTAMSGAVLSFSDADLRACAAAYDPAKHEAPIVVGHPQTDDPAFGWIERLDFAGGSLEALPRQIDPAFAELVEAGRFKKISASFYLPEAPGNPVPGVFYLRHVGFLGAQPPAIKGLRPAAFADSEPGLVVEFADWSDLASAGLWRRLREWIIARFGIDEAEQTIPEQVLTTLDDEARQEAADEAASPLPSFAETGAAADPQALPISDPPEEDESKVTEAEKAALEAENAQLKTRLEQADQALRELRTQRVHEANAAFAETLIGSGKLLPAQSAVVVAALDHLALQDSPVEFGEGDEKQPLATAVRTLLSSLPKQVEFGRVAGRRASPELDDPQAIARAAQDFQESERASGRNVSIAQAVAHVLHQ
ncbi:peptidase [Accumulibacter sp.]|uniref:peptidase n=1 Tax=Accumulibacter sp. TaxID=2053492 RepID=UPI0025D5FB7E|nr:peptidase [Accumulibacter sp.]MCM8625528.1 peptidase [Accumulibacter sp.]